MNLGNILQMFGGQTAFTNKVNSFGQQCQSQGINPEERVRQLVNSGQMSQEQFNQFAQIANMLTGRK